MNHDVEIKDEEDLVIVDAIMKKVTREIKNLVDKPKEEKDNEEINSN